MFREIFTWWNRQTLGTRIWSYFNGIQVGTDDQGNRYFKNRKDTKRWVVYGGIVESTYVSPEWNNWLRFTSLKEPNQTKKYAWQKSHIPNLTGTKDAYNPEITKNNNKQSSKNADYKRWSPKN